MDIADHTFIISGDTDLIQSRMPLSESLLATFAVLTLLLLASGCGRSVDSTDAPAEVSSRPSDPTPPLPAVESVADNTDASSDLPSVDPAQLQDDAIDALDSGDLDTAFKLVRAAIAATPEDPQTIFLMARVLAERNRFGQAIKMLDDLAVTFPEARFAVLGQTAEWLVLQGQWQQAEQRYRELLDQVPDATMVDRQLAQLLNRQGRRLEAAISLDKLCRAGDIEELELRSLLIGLHPFAGESIADENEPIGALGKARYEIGQGDWDAALKLLDPSTANRPDEMALRGRVLAQQQNFEALAQWVMRSSESDQETADHWFAMGVDHARHSHHRAAVECFCQTVLRDPTDAAAYLLLSQSLEQLGLRERAKEASDRSGQIAQTQAIGEQMVASTDRAPEEMSTLISALEQLHRPFESLAWQAMSVVYGQTKSGLSDDAVRQQLAEINRERLQLLKSGDSEASKEFLVCGVDLDSLPEKGEDASHLDEPPGR